MPYRAGVHRQRRLARRILELPLERPHLQEVDVAPGLPLARRISVSGTDVIADDISGRDIEIFRVEGMEAGAAGHPLATKQVHDPLDAPGHRVDQVEAVEGKIILGARLDHHLLERRDLAVSTGPANLDERSVIGQRRG